MAFDPDSDDPFNPRHQIRAALRGLVPTSALTPDEQIYVRNVQARFEARRTGASAGRAFMDREYHTAMASALQNNPGGSEFSRPLWSSPTKSGRSRSPYAKSYLPTMGFATASDLRGENDSIDPTTMSDISDQRLLHDWLHRFWKPSQDTYYDRNNKPVDARELLEKYGTVINDKSLKDAVANALHMWRESGAVLPMQAVDIASKFTNKPYSLISKIPPSPKVEAERSRIQRSRAEAAFVRGAPPVIAPTMAPVSAAESANNQINSFGGSGRYIPQERSEIVGLPDEGVSRLQQASAWIAANPHHGEFRIQALNRAAAKRERIRARNLANPKLMGISTDGQSGGVVGGVQNEAGGLDRTLLMNREDLTGGFVGGWRRSAGGYVRNGEADAPVMAAYSGGSIGGGGFWGRFRGGGGSPPRVPGVAKGGSGGGGKGDLTGETMVKFGEAVAAFRVVKGFEMAINAGQGFGSGVGAIAKGIDNAVLGAAGAFKHVGDTILGLILSPFGVEGKGISGAVGGIGSAALGIAGAGGAVAAAGVKIGTQLIAGLTGVVATGGGTIIGALIGGLFTGGSIPGIIGGAGLGAGLVGGIASMMGQLMSSIGGAVGQALGAIGSAFGKLGSAISDVLTNIQSVLADLVTTGVNWANSILGISRSSGMSISASSQQASLAQIMTGSPSGLSGQFSGFGMMSPYISTRFAAEGAYGVSGDDPIGRMTAGYKAWASKPTAMQKQIALRVMYGSDADQYGQLFSRGSAAVQSAALAAKENQLSPAQVGQQAALGQSLDIIQAKLMKLKLTFLTDLMPAIKGGIALFINYFTSHESQIINTLANIGKWFAVDFPGYVRSSILGAFDFAAGINSLIPTVATAITGIGGMFLQLAHDFREANYYMQPMIAGAETLAALNPIAIATGQSKGMLSDAWSRMSGQSQLAKDNAAADKDATGKGLALVNLSGQMNAFAANNALAIKNGRASSIGEMDSLGLMKGSYSNAQGNTVTDKTFASSVRIDGHDAIKMIDAINKNTAALHGNTKTKEVPQSVKIELAPSVDFHARIINKLAQQSALAEQMSGG